MIIDCVSDLHGHFPELEGGDLLIVAGDCTTNDKIPAWKEFFDWFGKQKYRKKIIIGGNHDNFCQNWCRSNDSIYDIIGERPEYSYLFDSGEEFEGLKIWGSPWTKTFQKMNPLCMAFTVNTEDQLMDKWNLIPDKTDILITHTPPYGVLDDVQDMSYGFENQYKRRCGSPSLHNWLKYVGRPKLHVFGHIHSGYGKGEFFPTDDDKMMISVNASHMDEFYYPANPPIRIELHA